MYSVHNFDFSEKKKCNKESQLELHMLRWHGSGQVFDTLLSRHREGVKNMPIPADINTCLQKL